MSSLVVKIDSRKTEGCLPAGQVLLSLVVEFEGDPVLLVIPFVLRF